jgi:hypothetical protein
VQHGCPRLFTAAVMSAAGMALAADLMPQSPASLRPGSLGVQLRRSWQESKHSHSLRAPQRKAVGAVREFDEGVLLADGKRQPGRGRADS